MVSQHAVAALITRAEYQCLMRAACRDFTDTGGGNKDE